MLNLFFYFIFTNVSVSLTQRNGSSNWDTETSLEPNSAVHFLFSFLFIFIYKCWVWSFAVVFSQFLAFTTYLGWLGAGWWRQPDDSINCTQQEMDDVASNHFDINIDSLPLDSYRGRTVSGLVRFISYYFQKRELQDSSLKKKYPLARRQT